MTSRVTYLGELRTESIHLASQSILISDAPVDNHGKGAAFSPTDTVANALASCMLTVMGIKADQMQVDMTGTVAEVTKVMGDAPRRISEIHIHVLVKGVYEAKHQQILENTARTCPVLQSLHPDLVKHIVFSWE
jgi:putative redox protein